MPIIAVFVLIISAFLGGAYLNKEGKVLPSSTSLKPVVETSPTLTLPPFPTLTSTPIPSPTPTTSPTVLKLKPTSTLIPTLTPNSGKETALKAIEEKIKKIDGSIAYLQAAIDKMMEEEAKCGSIGSGINDPYQQEIIRSRCSQQTFSIIRQLEAKMDPLIREKNELERQKFSIMAQ